MAKPEKPSERNKNDIKPGGTIYHQMHAVRRLFTRLMSKVSEDARVLNERGYHLFSDSNLGEGTYAKVKCAYSNNTKQHVAVKVIDRKRAPKDFITKFLPREMVVIQSLRHKNIIDVLQVFEVGEKVYVVMELAEKGDLLEYIKKNGCVREWKAKKIFKQLLEAVKFCHRQGVVHRDLKCENVLLDKHFNVKLTDFGFSKFNPRKELCKTFCGSAAYAALEILQGIEYNAEKADIWSLGVILYTMVTGRMPFDDTDMSKLKKQIKTGVEFRKPKQYISDECKDLIKKMMATNHHYRITIPDIETHTWLGSAASTRSRIQSSQSSSE